MKRLLKSTNLIVKSLNQYSMSDLSKFFATERDNVLRFENTVNMHNMNTEQKMLWQNLDKIATQHFSLTLLDAAQKLPWLKVAIKQCCNSNFLTWKVQLNKLECEHKDNFVHFLLGMNLCEVDDNVLILEATKYKIRYSFITLYQWLYGSTTFYKSYIGE